MEQRGFDLVARANTAFYQLVRPDCSPWFHRKDATLPELADLPPSDGWLYSVDPRNPNRHVVTDVCADRPKLA